MVKNILLVMRLPLLERRSTAFLRAAVLEPLYPGQAMMASVQETLSFDKLNGVAGSGRRCTGDSVLNCLWQLASSL